MKKHIQTQQGVSVFSVLLWGTCATMWRRCTVKPVFDQNSIAVISAHIQIVYIRATKCGKCVELWVTSLNQQWVSQASLPADSPRLKILHIEQSAG